METRIGFGQDVHRLEAGRKLILGGVHIPGDKGIVAHSDGDVLIHAICDALLGAMGLGDIGTHFPDTSPEFRGIDSRILLGRVMEMIRARGYAVGNLDAVINLEQPRIAGYVPAIKEELSKLLGAAPGDVSVKATTTEQLGFAGRGEGVVAYAVVLLYKAK